MTVQQVLAQGSGGSVSRSFAEPAAHAFAEFLQQVQHRLQESCKLIQDIESVLRLLKGPLSLSYIDDDEGEQEDKDVLEQAQPESGDELEVI
jgi:hypothetical protein